MTGNIGKMEFANMFAQAAACIRSEHQRLTELDSIGGDGDHGTTMLRAAEQMEGWTRRIEYAKPHGLLKAAGWRVLGVDGGASSVLLGTFFAGMGDIELGQDAMNCNDLAQSLQAGLRAVSRQTKARPGDKTMMDALIPAVDAVSAAASAGKTIPQALDDAALAAKLGAESTRDFGCPLWPSQISGRENARSSGCGSDYDRPYLQRIQGRIRQKGALAMADLDNLQDGKNYYLDVPPQSTPSRIKGSNALDWGMKNRLARIFDPHDARTVMLAIDHGYFQGPTTGLERIDVTIVPLISYADALMVTRGGLRSSIPAEMARPVVLRSSGGQSILKELSNELVAVDIDDAIRLNASALAVQVYIGGVHEHESIGNLVKVVDSGNRYGIPTMAVTGVGKDLVRDAKYLGLATRICAEMGAHFVKTYFCEKGFSRVAAGCPVPLVIAGERSYRSSKPCRWLGKR